MHPLRIWDKVHDGMLHTAESYTRMDNDQQTSAMFVVENHISWDLAKTRRKKGKREEETKSWVR